MTLTLKEYDVLGNKVATILNEEKPEDGYRVEFSGHSGLPSGIVRSCDSGLSSGVYFHKITAVSFVPMNKILFLKQAYF